jgi:hypothetical protein
MDYGITAGFGKAGAAIGTQSFTPLENAAGKASTFYLAGGVCVLGTIVHCFLPEGKDADFTFMDAELEQYMMDEGYTDKMVEESD